MKTKEDILQRLLRSASQAAPGPQDPSVGLEGRIIAAWRDNASRESFDPFAILRPVLIGAFAVVCVAGALEYKISTDSADPATFVTNSAFQMALNR